MSSSAKGPCPPELPWCRGTACPCGALGAAAAPDGQGTPEPPGTWTLGEGRALWVVPAAKKALQMQIHALAPPPEGWPRPRRGEPRSHSCSCGPAPGRLAPPCDRIPEHVAPPHPGQAEAGRVPATPPCLGARPGLPRDTQPAGWAGLGGRARRRPELQQPGALSRCGPGPVYALRTPAHLSLYRRRAEGQPLPQEHTASKPSSLASASHAVLGIARRGHSPRCSPDAVHAWFCLGLPAGPSNHPPGGWRGAGRGRFLGAAARRDRVSTTGP